MAYLLKNNANSVLASAINSLVTSISVQTGHGDRFPVVASPDFTKVTLEDASGNREILKVTARSAASDTFTVERAQEGTAARNWAAGDVVELRFTAETIQTILNGTEAHITDTSDAHDASAISVVPTGNLTSSNAQDALVELQVSIDTTESSISAHLTDSDDAHDASAISYQGSTNLAATNVEAALDELDAEKVNKSGDSLSGGLNFKRSTVASTATDTPLWDIANGNIQDWTGTPTITDFPDAPQAGATRTAYPTAGTIIRNNGNIAVQGEENYKIKSGDCLIITAITISTFYVLIHRKDGHPPISRVGEIFMWPFPTPPSYALVRNGAAVSRTKYPELHELVANQGYPWGAGDGSTTFNIPNLPAEYIDVSAFTGIGTVTLGEVKSHFHAGGSTSPIGAYSAGGSSMGTYANTGATGGIANLAAGVHALPCICFK